MSDSSQAIEVEIVEIDGAAPIQKFENDGRASRPQPWKNRPVDFLGKLDRRWWPLWILLGIIVLALLLTVGLVVGVMVIIVKTLRRLIRAIIG
jgi:hypothetical protein